jgi:hypothetical protein
MNKRDFCLGVCPVQCWVAENSAVLTTQSDKLHDGKELVEVDRELTAAEYLAKLDENAQHDTDNELLDLAEIRRTWLAQEYTNLERTRDAELHMLNRELDGRQEVLNAIRATGATALGSCRGIDDQSGLCTGEIDKDYLRESYGHPSA